MPQIILPFILLGEFLTTPKFLLFYDQIEYLRIVSTSSFLQVFSQGHFPVHPVFLALFWISTKFVEPNLTALIFGTISVTFMYLVSKIIFKNGRPWIPTLIFSLFPGVWLVNTNLMTESMLLSFYLASLCFFLRKKYTPFFIGIFLMLGIHVEAIYWIPTIFLFPFIFNKEVKFSKTELTKFIKLGLASVGISIFFYAFIYFIVRKEFGGSTEQLMVYGTSGILRILRNIWLSFIRNFGSLTPFIFAIVVFKKIKARSEWIAWFIFGVAVSIGGAFWAGDLMMRRIVFAGVILSLYFYKRLANQSLWIALYLLPIIIGNGMLYFRGNTAMPLITMADRESQLPRDQVLIQTRYLKPFTKYNGTILWIGESDLSKIDNYLNNGKRVFLDKEAVTAPYRLLVGNNYHITSLSKVGDSESRFLFSKYKISALGEEFELEKYNGKVSPKAGDPMVFYSSGFWETLTRRRVDYGDIGSWIWTLATNRRDSTGWTYRDVEGNY